MNAYLSTADLALETAESYMDAAWIEIDVDDYDYTAIESRLELVRNMLKSAEYALNKVAKNTAEA